MCAPFAGSGAEQCAQSAVRAYRGRRGRVRYHRRHRPCKAGGRRLGGMARAFNIPFQITGPDVWESWLRHVCDNVFVPSGSSRRFGSRTRALSEAHSDPKPQNRYALSPCFRSFARQVTLKSGLSADPARQRAILQPFLEEARSLGISHDIVDAAHSKLKVAGPYRPD